MSHGFGEDFEAARAGADGQAAPRPRDPIASSGFGSPGSDFTVKRIDFNDALIRHVQAPTVMRMSGDAVREAGVLDGDMLVNNRAIGATHGHGVFAKLDGELVCRRLVKADGAVEQGTAVRAGRDSLELPSPNGRRSLPQGLHQGHRCSAVGYIWSRGLRMPRPPRLSTCV